MTGNFFLLNLQKVVKASKNGGQWDKEEMKRNQIQHLNILKTKNIRSKTNEYNVGLFD